MRRLLASATAIALLALAVAGCGGGGDSSSSSGSSSGGETVAASGGSSKVDQACATANKKLAALGTPDTDQAVLEYLEKTEETVSELQVEVAGAGGSDGVTKYADALAESVSVLGEMTNAARSRNPDAVRELSKELEQLKVGQLAEAAGLETCAEAPGVES